MKIRLILLVLGAVFLSALTFGGTALANDEASGDSRRVDFEAGGGFLLQLDKDVPLDDAWLWGASMAVQLTDRVDLEFGYAEADGEPDKSAVSPSSGGGRGVSPGPSGSQDPASRSVNYFNVGFRYYMNADTEKRVRPYISMGYSHYDGMRAGTDTNAFSIGPGIRMRAGEKSGVVLKAPIMMFGTSPHDRHMLLSLNFFYEFDFAGGGLN